MAASLSSENLVAANPTMKEVKFLLRFPSRKRRPLRFSRVPLSPLMVLKFLR